MPLKINKLVLVTVLLTFSVIMLGSYTRLKDAGLGCPDWPGCYGKLLAPEQDSKAWIEMIHRYVAGSLGLLILAITIVTLKIYKLKSKLSLLAIILSGLVLFQALLGMWTVTLGLYPVVVMGHLLGGFAILAISWLLYLHLQTRDKHTKQNIYLNISASMFFIMLIVQIALGGWTSANYAALVCADFPTCQGHWWPPLDLHSAFNLSATGIFNSPGVPLENTARVTIQVAHRIGALIVSLLAIVLSYYLFRSKTKTLKQKAWLLIVLLITQLSLGIANVLARLPLTVSLMHSAVAALLLILSITILFELYAESIANK